jgi:2-phosphosulfolactate phosphatase
VNIAVVQFSPVLDVENFSGSTIAVIDVLRATTTIACALGNGASDVVPVASVEQAFALARDAKDRPLLAGEVANAPIPGFDLSNSPAECEGERVFGRRVVLRTTNGTQALAAFSREARVYCAAFVNLHAVGRAIGNTSNDVALICAGQDGEFSLEDFLCAGAVADVIAAHMPAELDDAALAARELYRASADRLEAVVRTGNHAKALIALGFGDDITLALDIDRHNVIPLLENGSTLVAATA